MPTLNTTPETKKELLTLCMARDSWSHAIVALDQLRQSRATPEHDLYDVLITAAAVLYMRPFERSDGLNRLTAYETFGGTSESDTLRQVHTAVDRLRNQIVAHQQVSGWDRLLRGVPEALPADRLVIRIGGGEPMSYEVGGPVLDPNFLPAFSHLVRFQEARVNGELFNRVASVLPPLIEGRAEFLIEASSP